MCVLGFRFFSGISVNGVNVVGVLWLFLKLFLREFCRNWYFIFNYRYNYCFLRGFCFVFYGDFVG